MESAEGRDKGSDRGKRQGKLQMEETAKERPKRGKRAVGNIGHRGDKRL